MCSECITEFSGGAFDEAAITEYSECHQNTQNVIWMTESQESFLGADSTSQPSQESFLGGSEAGGGIDSAAFLQQDNDNDIEDIEGKVTMAAPLRSRPINTIKSVFFVKLTYILFTTE